MKVNQDTEYGIQDAGYRMDVTFMHHELCVLHHSIRVYSRLNS